MSEKRDRRYWLKDTPLTRRLAAAEQERRRRKRVVKNLAPIEQAEMVDAGKGLDALPRVDELTQRSLETLRSVAADAAAPAAARTAAARTLAEIAGLVGRRKTEQPQGDGRPTAELSLDELDKEIAALQALGGLATRPKRRSPG